MPSGGFAKQLIVARNGRHLTIDRLERAIGHRGMIDNLSVAALTRGRIPKGEHINLIAAHLDDTHPIELLIAYARDAEVRIPPQVDDTYRLTARLGRLNRDERRQLVEILSVFAEMLTRARRQRRR